MFPTSQTPRQRLSMGFWFAFLPAAFIIIAYLVLIVVGFVASWNTRHDEFGGLSLALPVIAILGVGIAAVEFMLLRGLAKQRKGAQYTAILVVPISWSVIANSLTTKINAGLQSTLVSIIFFVALTASLVIYIKEARQHR